MAVNSLILACFFYFYSSSAHLVMHGINLHLLLLEQLASFMQTYT